jgi:demethylmenaquinone methyltransferase/2-methoxy-6-polyprenyl-1,4-benzoquinol methylase
VEWDDRQPLERQAKLDTLLARFKPYFQTASQVLEVGTGTGSLIPLLKKHYPKPRIFQIDFANAMLLRARENHNGDQLVQADVHELPITRGRFSVVICHNSFPHFKEKLVAWREMRRVLQVGGTLLILHEMSRPKVNYIHRHALAKEIHQDLLPSGEEMKKIFSQVGFTPEIIEDFEDHYAVCARA